MSFLTSLAHHIKNHYDLRNEELVVVFPNKRAAFYLRSVFREIYTDNIWLPQMLSIQEAMTQWSGMELVDAVDMLFELISIDSELYHNDNNISIFGKMAAPMANDFDEIDQYAVDANYLFSYIEQEKRIGTWHPDQEMTLKEENYLRFYESLKHYYHLLRERLKGQGRGYYGMITRYLSELDDTELLEKAGGRKIIFAGFNALTPTEQKIIDKLYRNQLAEVIWDFDRYYVEDPQNEAGLFARRYLEKDLPWKPKSFSDEFLQENKDIYLVDTKGNTIQTKALQSLLQVSVEDSPKVILADENLMIPVLNSIPEDPRFTSMKVSMGYPMRQTSLYDFVAACFTLRRKGRKARNGKWRWYIWPIIRIMDLELMKVVFNTQEIGELDSFKRHIRNHSVFLFDFDEFNVYCKSADLREFMGLLLGTVEIGDTPQSVLMTLRRLLAFVANKIQHSGNTDNMLFLLNQVSETGKVINRLNSVMKRYPDYVNNLDELEVLYRLVSQNTTIKLNSTAKEGVQIMGLLEARNLDFDTYYLIGVNEGVLPTGKSDGSFIPYPIRKECHLPDYQEKQAVYAYHFYRQLQGAKTAYFIYNSNVSDSNGEPSRFLLQLKYELAKQNPKVKIHEAVFPNKTEKQRMPESLVANKTEEVMEALMRKIETDDVQQALAPTSISVYIKCPLRFFMYYLMKIKDERLEEKTQSNVVGSLVHDALQQFYSIRLNQRIESSVYDDPIVVGQELSDVGFNYLDQITIGKMLDNYKRYEKEDVAKHELKILQVEHTLSTQLQVNGVLCTIAGKADRIDSHDGQIRIIDYKTGLLKEADVKVSAKIKDIRNIPEKAMQLMIYKYLYLKEHPELQPKDVTAALFGLKNQNLCFDLNVELKELNDDFMGYMEALLTETLSAMMDRSVPFTQPIDTKVKPCHFCPAKAICAHTAIGSKLADDH